MKTFKVHLKNSTQASIEAASFTKDGSGVRLFDNEGNIIAMFSDGEVAYVIDSSIVFDSPPTEEESEE